CETPPSNIDRRKEGFHMSETSFTDDLKHMVRHTADRVQNGLQPALSNLRALPKATKIKIGACAAAIVLFVGGLALRGNTLAPVVDSPPVRNSDLRPAPAETPHAARNYAVGKAEQANGSHRAAAESYANAARQGNKRALTEPGGTTHAEEGRGRSGAAQALGP